MRPLLIAVAVLALSACKQEAPAPVAVPLPAPKAVPAPAPKADPVADLWAWVPAHLDELKAVQTGQEPAADALGGKLDAIDPGLTFELGLGREPFELIISADGHKELFPVVKRVVDAAPAMPGVKVIAFRPRKDPAFRLTVEGVTVGGPDVSYVAVADDGRPGLIALTLYVKGLTPENKDAVEGAAFLLLEAVVGEFDLETKIGGIQILAAPKKAPAGAKPLAELPGAVDAWPK